MCKSSKKEAKRLMRGIQVLKKKTMRLMKGAKVLKRRLIGL